MAFQLGLGAKKQLEVLVCGFSLMGVPVCPTGQQSQLGLLPSGDGISAGGSQPPVDPAALILLYL